jgi:hypothetical protein
MSFYTVQDLRVKSRRKNSIRRSPSSGPLPTFFMWICLPKELRNHGRGSSEISNGTRKVFDAETRYPGRNPLTRIDPPNHSANVFRRENPRFVASLRETGEITVHWYLSIPLLTRQVNKRGERNLNGQLSVTTPNAMLMLCYSVGFTIGKLDRL